MGDRRIGRRLTLVALLGLLAVLAFWAFFGSTSANSYVGSEKCGDCHDDTYELWEEVFHGTDFANDWDYHGTSGVNKYTLYGPDVENGTFGSCAPCHVVGWDDTENDGVRPDEAWNSTHNEPLMRIGCENCHGPGGDHVDDRDNAMSLMNNYTWALSCAGVGYGNGDNYCHDWSRQGGTDTHPGFYDSGHMSGIPDFAKQLDCYHCMASDGFVRVTVNGEEVDEVPDDAIWQITCAACHDPHPGEESHVQLRMDAEDLCGECHRGTHEFPDDHVTHPTYQFRNGMDGKDVDSVMWMEDVTCVDCHMYRTSFQSAEEDLILNHDFHAKPQGCVNCHSMYTNDSAEEAIDSIQAMFTTMMTPFGDAETTGTIIGDAYERKAWAEANDLWTDDTNMTFWEALWNYQQPVADGSMGVHNPEFMKMCFESAEEKFMEVMDDTDMGGVGGTLTWSGDDGGAIEGAVIVDGSGATVATTDADGMYFFWAESGSMTFFVQDADGNWLGSMDADVTTMQNVTKDVAFEPPSTGGDDDDEETDTMTYVFIGIIVLLIIILIVVAMMGKKSE